MSDDELALKWRWQNAIRNRELTEGLSSTDHHVGLVLSLYADLSGKCWPSKAEIAEVSHLAERTVGYSLKHLQQFGWVKKLSWGKEGKGSSVYQLTLPDGTDHLAAAMGSEPKVLVRDPATGEIGSVPFSEWEQRKAQAEAEEGEAQEWYENRLREDAERKPVSALPEVKQRELYERQMAQEEGLDANGEPLRR